MFLEKLIGGKSEQKELHFPRCPCTCSASPPSPSQTMCCARWACQHHSLHSELHHSALNVWKFPTVSSLPALSYSHCIFSTDSSPLPLFLPTLLILLPSIFMLISSSSFSLSHPFTNHLQVAISYGVASGLGIPALGSHPVQTFAGPVRAATVSVNLKVVSRRPWFLDVLHLLWLLSHTAPWAPRRGIWWKHLLWLNVSRSLTLCILPDWISVFIPIWCRKRLLQGRLIKARIYEYSRMSLVISKN